MLYTTYNHRLSCRFIGSAKISICGPFLPFFLNFCNYLKNGSLFVPKILQELKASVRSSKMYFVSMFSIFIFSARCMEEDFFYRQVLEPF